MRRRGFLGLLGPAIVMAPSLMRVSVLTPELLMPIHRALLTPDIIVREALLYLEDELSKVRHA